MVSQSVEFDSQSTAGGDNHEDSSNLEVEADLFLSSYSAVTEEDLGTNSTLGDMSYSFDSFLQECYESQGTSTMLPNLSNTVALPVGSPGPAAASDQSFREGMPLDARMLDQGRSAERQAELEAETTALRQDTGAAQIRAEDIAHSGQSERHSDWHLEQAGGLEGSRNAAPSTSLPGRVASTRPLAREIHHHHHHHHYHHYHHHHYHN